MVRITFDGGEWEVGIVLVNLWYNVSLQQNEKISELKSTAVAYRHAEDGLFAQ